MHHSLCSLLSIIPSAKALALNGRANSKGLEDQLGLQQSSRCRKAHSAIGSLYEYMLELTHRSKGLFCVSCKQCL
jgi:hypothetical protein